MRKPHQNCLILKQRSRNKKGFIYLLKNFASNAKPVSKIWIKYNSNYLEENDVEEKKPNDVEFTKQKVDNDYNLNANDFK